MRNSCAPLPIKIPHIGQDETIVNISAKIFANRCMS